MRVDHFAYRTRDRFKTSEFLQKALGYQVVEEFEIVFGDGTSALSIAHAPPEDRPVQHEKWTHQQIVYTPSILDERVDDSNSATTVEFHAPPEIFVSDGKPGTIVGDWVASKNGGKGGLHHIGYQVDDVQGVIDEWTKKGLAEFCSDMIEGPGLKQVFTKEHELTGLIYEFITRIGPEGLSFKNQNVRALMESTLNANVN
jgi:catechol 2,3-dioxygenase-like lactoylglutathione lyase family enzyme